jgi:hypothetical protein
MDVFLEPGNHASLHVDDKGSRFRISLNKILKSVLKELQLIKVPYYSFNRTRFSSIPETTETEISLVENSFLFF